VREYAQAEVRPRSMLFESAGGFPPRLFVELAGLGLMGMTAPEEAGGAGADYVSYALALIKLAAADGALSTIASIQNSLMISGIQRYGTEAQSARFLPELIAGRVIGAFALTETDAGSDASAMRTRATRVEGGWRLNGAKQFITSGKIAGVAMVFAVTDASAGKRGILGFLVPTDKEGYSVDKVEHKLGQAASDTCAIRSDDLFVENDLLFGEEGAGYRIGCRISKPDASVSPRSASAWRRQLSRSRSPMRKSASRWASRSLSIRRWASVSPTSRQTRSEPPTRSSRRQPQ
jgi:alkylation response protein AidB-like acyl-CoA dehydrogenase